MTSEEEEEGPGHMLISSLLSSQSIQWKEVLIADLVCVCCALFCRSFCSSIPSFSSIRLIMWLL